LQPLINQSIIGLLNSW